MFDKVKYDREYLRKNIILKNLSFNRLKPEDMEMLEWLGQHKSMNAYVKSLIRADMLKRKPD